MENIIIAQKYFSRHMRASISGMAVSVAFVAEELIHDFETLAYTIEDTTYLMDLFDAGLELTVLYTFKKYPFEKKPFDVAAALSHFIKKSTHLIEGRSIECALSQPMKAMPVEADAHVIKTIVGLIAYEIILQTIGLLEMQIDDRSIGISLNEDFVMPEIWTQFKLILADNDIILELHANKCILEYNK